MNATTHNIPKPDLATNSGSLVHHDDLEVLHAALRLGHEDLW